MVADEVSLFESARRLQSDLAVVDLALSRGNGLELVRQFRGRFPEMKLIIVSIHDQSSVSRSVLEAGANGFVARRAIATDLLAATDAVLAGQRYVSPETSEPAGRRLFGNAPFCAKFRTPTANEDQASVSSKE